MSILSRAELEKRYASMSSDEFVRLNRANLTEEGKEVYDREVEHRKTPEWLAAEAQREQEFLHSEQKRLRSEQRRLRNKSIEEGKEPNTFLVRTKKLGVDWEFMLTDNKLILTNCVTEASLDLTKEQVASLSSVVGDWAGYNLKFNFNNGSCGYFLLVDKDLNLLISWLPESYRKQKISLSARLYELFIFIGTWMLTSVWVFWLLYAAVSFLSDRVPDWHFMMDKYLLWIASLVLIIKLSLIPYKKKMRFHNVDYAKASCEQNTVATDLLDNGIKLEGKGHYDAAINLYQKIIQEFPDTEFAKTAQVRLEYSKSVQ